MTIINVSPNRLVQIGYEGEDKVTILRFSYSDKWLENGDGIFTVRVLRNGENKAYNAQMVDDDRENSTIDMTVTDVELSKKGYGEMQLVYTGADFVKKSSVYKYYVSRSVGEPVDPPAQDVYTQIIESLSDLQTNVQGLSDAVDGIGNLADLTTEAKTDLVSAINEVNAKEGGGGGGGSVTVDDALSTTSENPVQNKVITSAIRGKADTQTVSALADEVNGLDSDVQGLQIAMQSKADTATVTALSGTVSDLQTSVQGKADAQTVTTLSGTVTDLQTGKADKSYVDTGLAGKASTATATASSDGLMSAQDKSKLDGLDNGISDVRVNGTSVVTDGVAEMPIAMLPKSGYAAGNFGVVALKPYRGIAQNNEDKSLFLAYPSANELKQGIENFKAVNVSVQHSATFYGLAKAAGHDEKNSTLPVGTYSEEAKTAIRTMLGLQDVYDDYSSALTALGVI